MIQGKTCRNCHSPHFSKQKHLLERPAQELCLTCHSQAIQSAERTIASLTDEIKDAQSLHAPMKEGDCSACHRAHGSPHPDLLETPLPTAFYAEYEAALYAACYKCHEKSAIESEENTQTDFRNGTQNLHYLHVFQGKKGHTCRVCHQPHAAKQARLIRQKITFGKWEMPLTLTVTQTGGSCATGCHPTFEYDRQTPVTNSGRRTAGIKADGQATSPTLPAQTKTAPVRAQ
jgi:predicted CXXCH cytochrome family protein